MLRDRIDLNEHDIVEQTSMKKNSSIHGTTFVIYASE